MKVTNFLKRNSLQSLRIRPEILGSLRLLYFRIPKKKMSSFEKILSNFKSIQILELSNFKENTVDK